MKIRLLHYYTFLLLIVTTSASAQYIEVDDTYTAQQMVEALVSNSCASVSNVSVNGWQDGISYGYFERGTSDFPFENGIVLSTGLASSAPGPNSTLLSEGGTDWPGDVDLQTALGVNNTINATVLEFDFVPLTNVISFDYIFSSEQYLTSITSNAQCNFTDGFAFLLKEVDSDTYQNLAVIPNTNIPVRVNTVRGTGVCPAANEQYFDAFNPVEHNTNYNGQTVILKAQANVTAGTTYHIKLVVADQGNNLYDSAIFLGGGSFTATTDLGNNRLLSLNNPLCEDETLLLDATYPFATGYEWFKDGAPINEANDSATYEVTEAGTYNVAVAITADCFSYGEVTIEYATNPEIVTRTLIQCDDNNDGLTTFNLNLATPLVTNENPNLGVNYYESIENAENGIDVITNTTLYENTEPDQEIYARVQNQHGCYSISTVVLATSANGVTTPTPIASCDEDDTDDGFFALNLNQRNDEILAGLPDNLELQYYLTAEDALEATNPIPNPENFTNTVAGGQTVYARIFGGSACYGIAELELIIYSFGENGTDEEVYLCDNNSVVLNAGAGFASYKWDTELEQDSQSITVIETGTYTVTITNNFGCEGSKTFTVLQSGIATDATITINDFTGNNNSITITPEGLGNYEYSLNGITYQDTNTFNRLPSGEYTVYIRDKNGCNPVYTDSVFVLDYPKFFTPNGDGTNETWRIPFMNSRPEIRVTIFDRYGKIVSGFKGASNGWDGNLDGKKLPATDYWFLITLENGKTIRGHFALVR
ncbi:T9SS type B sorting domain-containing protein [Flavobacterium litorale]|uniref:T9SS type B sorting domain-containing protein n=1 Tax=Flavobacterium litorale TaxID=2856519 RepID=A0ABX8V7S2_9FLAO|nr:choice-of-anchor L domain-containing protein [Flavobacterium litorale]QYJ68168.1 T9SS type B sorting domain-containing protein [Flavobacterium litorale]